MGLKLELCMLEPRRGSRLACDASRKVGQWATGSVNAFLSLLVSMDLPSRRLSVPYNQFFFQVNFNYSFLLFFLFLNTLLGVGGLN